MCAVCVLRKCVLVLILFLPKMDPSAGNEFFLQFSVLLCVFSLFFFPHPLHDDIAAHNLVLVCSMVRRRRQRLVHFFNCYFYFCFVLKTKKKKKTPSAKVEPLKRNTQLLLDTKENKRRKREKSQQSSGHRV